MDSNTPEGMAMSPDDVSHRVATHLYGHFFPDEDPLYSRGTMAFREGVKLILRVEAELREMATEFAGFYES